MLEYIPPGFYRDLSNKRYHGSQGLSSSTIKEYATKAGCEVEYNRLQGRSTKSKKTGSVLHKLTLEFNDFFDEFAIKPIDIKAPTKAQLEAKKPTDKALARFADWARWLDFLGDRESVTAEEYQHCYDMRKAVMANDEAQGLIENSIKETSIFWDDSSGILKVRPDIISTHLPIVGDLKSAVDVTYTGFAKAAHKYMYDISAAMYLEGVNQCYELQSLTRCDYFHTFKFVCVRNTRPFYCEVYDLSAKDLINGYNDYIFLLKRARRKQQSNGARILELPNYKREWKV